MGQFLLPSGRVACSSEPGVCIHDLAARAGILLRTHCGGQGTCGGCAVELLRGRFVCGAEPVELEAEGSSVSALGCQSVVSSDDFVIRVPTRSLVSLEEPVLEDAPGPRVTSRDPLARRLLCNQHTTDSGASDAEQLAERLAVEHGVAPLEIPLSVLRKLPGLMPGDSPDVVTADVVRVGDGWRLLDVEPGCEEAALWGIAVDLGTTTVSVGLVDLASGQLSCTASGNNRQIRYGDDVATRILASREPQATEELRRYLVSETVNGLIRRVCERRQIDPARIVRAACAGNTAMQMLACGISPKNLGVAPFNVPVRVLPTLVARELGLLMHSEAPVDFLPAVSGYLGGDLVGDLYTSAMLDTDARSLLIDLGTNAEIALGNRSGVWVCAAPAGPAWEGGRIARGVRASRGAIEHLTIDAATGDVTFFTLGDVPPSGLCGSALIDLLAEGVRVGLLTSTGLFSQQWLASSRVELETRPRASKQFVVAGSDQTADGTAIALSEADIAELLKAKAAVSGAVGTLLDVASWAPEDIDVVYLAGDFARHIELGNAVAIGLLPAVPLEKVTVLGNGSLAGALAALVDTSALPRMREIARAARGVELHRVPSFERQFIDGLLLPGRS